MSTPVLSDKQLEDVKAAFARGAKGGQRIDAAAAVDALFSLGLDSPKELKAPKAPALSFAEFSRAAAKAFQTTRVDAKYMSMAFSSWDTQKNGYITPAQMKHVMEANGSLPAGISQSDVREMLEFADANGDGKIQYNEFVRLLTQ